MRQVQFCCLETCKTEPQRKKMPGQNNLGEIPCLAQPCKYPWLGRWNPSTSDSSSLYMFRRLKMERKHRKVGKNKLFCNIFINVLHFTWRTKIHCRLNDYQTIEALRTPIYPLGYYSYFMCTLWEYRCWLKLLYTPIVCGLQINLIYITQLWKKSPIDLVVNNLWPAYVNSPKVCQVIFCATTQLTIH